MFTSQPAAIFDSVTMDNATIPLHVHDMFHIFHRFMLTRLDIGLDKHHAPSSIYIYMNTIRSLRCIGRLPCVYKHIYYERVVKMPILEKHEKHTYDA